MHGVREACGYNAVQPLTEIAPMHIFVLFTCLQQYYACGYLKDLCPGMRGALIEHVQQHAQQLRVLHVWRHHHSSALNHL